MVILAGLEAFLGPLGAILAPLGVILGPLGTILGGLGAPKRPWLPLTGLQGGGQIGGGPPQKKLLAKANSDTIMSLLAN